MLFLLTFLSIFTCILSVSTNLPFFDIPCQSDKLTSYKVILHTFWTRDRFPKHFPEWRPPAQWSKLIGRSHSHDFILFRISTQASQGVRAFAESGKSDSLEAESQGHFGLFDIFTAPPIPSGAGRTETQFFVDGNHSRISLMSHMIPSPDWFIGLDSFNLCVDGNWLDSITIEVDPLDAGTDNGFTFTAPNWTTEPQGVIYRITSRYPAHPASSFYYPYLKRLPPIATFQIIKLREYELNEVFQHSEDDKKYDVVAIEDQLSQHNSIPVLNNNDIAEEIEEQRREQELMIQHLPPKALITSPSIGSTVETFHALAPGVIRKGNKDALLNSMVETYHRKEDNHSDNIHSNMIPKDGFSSLKSDNFNNIDKIFKYSNRPVKKHQRKIRIPRDCRVSDWGQWSNCSSLCGIGEMQRRRTILKHPKRGGQSCPPLLETKWCGSGKECINKIKSNGDW